MVKSKLGKLNLKDIKGMSKQETIDRIINQANSLNKKILKFQNEGISEHYDYVRGMLGDIGVQYKEEVGTISKSRKFYNNVNILQLKRTLKALHVVNNSDVYGTVAKYNKTMSRQYSDIIDFTTKLLRKNGKTEKYIQEVVGNKNFLDTFVNVMNEGTKGLTSEAVIEKIAMRYGKDGEYKKNAKKTLRNIDNAFNKLQELDREKQAIEEYRNAMRR